MKCSFEEAMYGLTSHPGCGKEFRKKLELVGLGMVSRANEERQIRFIDSAKDENGMPLIYFHKNEFYVVEADTKIRIEAYRAQEQRKARDKRDSGIQDEQLRYRLLKEAGARV